MTPTEELDEVFLIGISETSSKIDTIVYSAEAICFNRAKGYVLYTVDIPRLLLHYLYSPRINIEHVDRLVPELEEVYRQPAVATGHL